MQRASLQHLKRALTALPSSRSFCTSCTPSPSESPNGFYGVAVGGAPGEAVLGDGRVVFLHTLVRQLQDNGNAEFLGGTNRLSLFPLASLTPEPSEWHHSCGFMKVSSGGRISFGGRVGVVVEGAVVFRGRSNSKGGRGGGRGRGGGWLRQWTGRRLSRCRCQGAFYAPTARECRIAG